jgi:16S rRNA G966 N2-methylase RsmD
MKDIDFALVEAKRPPMYTAMKYWGKKPHNIWGAYIENYTSENDVILDPFSGSAIAAFEAVKCGRKQSHLILIHLLHLSLKCIPLLLMKNYSPLKCLKSFQKLRQIKYIEELT